jgi:hypothetical protein
VRLAGPAQQPIVCGDDLYSGGAAALLAECEARGISLAAMAAELEGRRIGVPSQQVPPSVTRPLQGRQVFGK